MTANIFKIPTPQLSLAVAAIALTLAPGVHAQTKKSRHAHPAPAQRVILDPLTPTPPPPPLPITEADWRTPDPDNLLVVDTNKGRIIAELTPEAAPDTVARIKTLAKQHFYDGLTFFRVIDGFMDQTGDPKNKGDGGSSLPNVKGEFTFRRSRETPFVQVANPAGEVTGLMGALPVVSQPEVIMAMTADGKATAWPLFCPGVLGMARETTPDSGNSQFFFMRAAYPALEKRYTGFGRVIAGQEVVNAIKTGEPVPDPQDSMVRVRLADDLPAGEALHVRVLDPTKAAFKVLVERARDEKGADFSVCDLALPSQVK
ncbi:peptidylprolyl isomerase [Caulobacter sp. S45]|uniref:peptidylprolyl isomerase n=1 Tax=Caulobacter sp. S45 TaxID=1641861 RepID=UPI001575F749|nr:peptidylprolyl isomerase [Caulobacter sp. S45]